MSDDHVRQAILETLQRRSSAGAQTLLIETKKRLKGEEAKRVDVVLRDMRQRGEVQASGPAQRLYYSLPRTVTDDPPAVEEEEDEPELELPDLTPDDLEAMGVAPEEVPAPVAPPARNEDHPNLLAGWSSDMPRRECPRCQRQIFKNGWRRHSVSCYGTEVPWDWASPAPPVPPEVRAGQRLAATTSAPRDEHPVDAVVRHFARRLDLYVAEAAQDLANDLERALGREVRAELERERQARRAAEAERDEARALLEVADDAVREAESKCRAMQGELEQLRAWQARVLGAVTP